MQNIHAAEIMIKAGEYITDLSAKTLTPIFKMEYVCTLENWDDSITVYIFYKDELLKEQALSTGNIDMLKEKYITYLTNYKYPFDKFPKVYFEIDSHENVVRNFEGSYFYRLR